MATVNEKISILLEMIQFKLTVFALPFAFTGALLAGRGQIPFNVIVLIIVAMVGARTCAMTFNRIVDRNFDGENPRTSDRAIPAGIIKIGEAWAMLFISGMIFFSACILLNTLTAMLAPVALGLTLFYSLTKRFSALCHIVLGVALAFAPLGGWVAVSGSFSGYPIVLSLGVIFWVAGFDTIYACLDAEFDRKRGLYSLPATLGREKAFHLAGIFHICAFIFLAATGFFTDLNFIYYIGITLTAVALFRQHRLVRPEDLSRIHASFFSMNGFISVIICLSTWLSLASLG